MANLIGSGINQIPTNGLLGNLAFQDAAYVIVDKAGIGTSFVDTGIASQALQVNSGAYISGRVAIGTISTIDSLGNNTPFRLVNNDNTVTGAFSVESYGSANDAGFVGRKARGTLASPTQLFENDRFTFLVGSGFGTSTFVNTTSIEFRAAETQTETARGSYIRFDTTNTGSTGRTEKVRITASGFVGIGLTNPIVPLHVQGNTIITGINTVGLGSTSTPPSNSQMSFELTSNTNLRIKVRGTDGVLRSANITLA